MLLFFRARGRFPRGAAEIGRAVILKLARNLGVPEPSLTAPLLPDTADRTAERQRAGIRALLGFREAGVADAEALVPWLRVHAVARTSDPGQLAAEAEARCRALRIEPPTPDRIARIARAALRAYEDRQVAAVHARLTPAIRVSLDVLLQPSGPDAVAGAENGGLPDGLFADWSPAELETCRQRVAVEAPYELRRHPEAIRLRGSRPMCTCADARSPTRSSIR